MRKRLKLLSLIAVLTVIATACGSDSDDSSDTTTSGATATTSPARIDRNTQPTTATNESPRLRTTTTAAVPGQTTFEDYGLNPFVDPARDGLSTFAVDVDTGAYTLMRAWVNDGLLPDPDSVRVEEYVNYFDAGFEPPTQETFAIYADGGPIPFFDGRNDVLRIVIQ